MSELDPAKNSVPQNNVSPKPASPPQDGKIATDLSDPTSFELLDERSILNAKEGDAPLTGRLKTKLRNYNVQKSLISFEISHQQGVLIKKHEIIVPGRASLTSFTLLSIFGIVAGFAAGLIHFSVYSQNYLFALLVVSILLLCQVIVYDSSCRSRRIVLSVLQLVGTLILMALVDWAFIDQLTHPISTTQKRFLLFLSTVGFNFPPILMLAHVLYFGRGTRTIEIRRNIKPNESPTQILDNTKKESKPFPKTPLDAISGSCKTDLSPATQSSPPQSPKPS